MAVFESVYVNLDAQHLCIISFNCLSIDNAFFSGLFNMFFFTLHLSIALFICLRHKFFSFSYCVLSAASLSRLVYTPESCIAELPQTPTTRQPIVPICIIKQMYCLWSRFAVSQIGQLLNNLYGFAPSRRLIMFAYIQCASKRALQL
jgi:hypothetical protein